MLEVSFWQGVCLALVLIHVSVLCVTLYLHRSQAHGGVLFHPAVAHFMRFWLWLTTGTVTRQWVAVHRKHHESPDLPGDPHSPRVHGKLMALFFAHVLYRRAACDQEILDRYGTGTPDDWIERNLYARHSLLGILLLLIVHIVLFGFVGAAIWGSELMAILIGTTIINGVGHLWGYRNYPNQQDDSRNIFPVDVVLGGEALHQNHHAALRSPRLSRKWFEVDIGWLYIRFLAALRLARFRKIDAPEAWAA